MVTIQYHPRSYMSLCVRQGKMLRGFVLVICAYSLLAEKVRYDGHKVVRVLPYTQTDYAQLKDYEIYLNENGIDIWHTSNGPDSPLDFRVGPHQTHVLNKLKLWHTVIIPDVESLAQYTLKDNTERLLKQDGFNYGAYHKLSEIQDWISATEAAYPRMVEIFPIATSFEGRQLSGMKISANPLVNKPGIWLEGGIHAREWISPATVIYMTNQFLEQYDKDPNVSVALDNFDLYIVPVVNVDGYEYTWSTDRNWRKTRSTHSGSNCVGVDPNRNWDFHFCEAGASKDPCSDSYCGPAPFSEKVVMGISNTIKNIKNLVGFIDFHSYSQLWMTPWGYTKDIPKDFMQQNASSAAAVEAIESVFQTKYKYGTIANIIYVASGSSADWTYGSAGVKYSAGVELRDMGKYGFLLPPEQIIPSGQETLKGVLAWMDYIKQNM